MQYTLRNLRMSSGLTKQQLAHGLRVSLETISLLEDGLKQPDVGLLIKIASFFKVSIDYLLGHPDILIYSNEQIELLEVFNSLNDVSKGILLERAMSLAEESFLEIKEAGLLGWRVMLFTWILTRVIYNSSLYTQNIERKI